MTNYEYSISSNTLGQLNSYTLLKQISESTEVGQSASYIEGTGDLFRIYFVNELSLHQKAALDLVVSAHNGRTTTEQLSEYLATTVRPFVDNLINEFAAENISLGITQAGKTADVLGLFEKQQSIGALHPVSLKASFDACSLYVSIAVIAYVRANPGEYSGLSPFVTDARLKSMQNKIEVFLGVPVSP